jgi:hypothetical protein
MPRIIVMSEARAKREHAITVHGTMGEPTTSPENAVTLDERITSEDLRSGHHSAQLIERVGWAVHDADDAELGNADAGRSAARRLRSSARQAKALTN